MDYLSKKKRGHYAPSECVIPQLLLHEVINSYLPVILISISSQGTSCRKGSSTASEWILNYAVTSLEANLWLEGILAYRTDHL
jgi:hypothetical protein